jgi:hypothetical protein
MMETYSSVLLIALLGLLLLYLYRRIAVRDMLTIDIRLLNRFIL